MVRTQGGGFRRGNSYSRAGAIFRRGFRHRRPNRDHVIRIHDRIRDEAARRMRRLNVDPAVIPVMADDVAGWELRMVPDAPEPFAVQFLNQHYPENYFELATARRGDF